MRKNAWYHSKKSSAYSKKRVLQYLKQNFALHQAVRVFVSSRSLIVSALLFLFCGVVYFKSLLGYFQADEWYFFAKNFSYLSKSSNFFTYFFVSLSDATAFNAHFTPVVQLITYLQMMLFSTNYVPYQLMSIVLHGSISVAIFYLSMLITKRNLLFSALAGAFFALNYAHFQTIAWVAASSAQISLLFAVSSLIFLTLYLEKRKRMYHILSLFFLTLAVLTKETALFLFVVYPFYYYLIEKGKLKQKLLSLKFFFISAAFYLLLRILYSWFFNFQTQLSTEKVSYQFFIQPDVSTFYKAATLILKSLVQVFVPSPLISGMGELITLWGFPHYAQEAKIRGINYLIFSQSAGMELFIYPMAIIIVLIIGFILFSFRKNQNIKNVIYLGLLIIVFSVAPFVLITNSLSQLFGYVTLLDSRHMYSVSFGASFIFALIFYYLFTITRNFRRKIFGVILPGRLGAIVLITLWVGLQVFFINGVLNEYAFMGTNRKTVIKKIFSSIPILPKKTAVLVKSNTAYYGFGSIPPFQTNLGQILATLYYEKGQLPFHFLTDDFLVKGGIAGEGYIEYKNRGFGYYITEKRLFSDLNKNLFSSSDVYAFSWDGKKANLSDISQLERDFINQFQQRMEKFSEWNKYIDADGTFSVWYPRDMYLLDATKQEGNDVTIKSVVISSGQVYNPILPDFYNGLFIKIAIKKKPITMGFGELITFLKNSDGEDVGSSYIFRNIELINGDMVTASYPIKGTYPEYFFPTHSNALFYEISIVGDLYKRLSLSERKEKYYADVEEIISTIHYEE